MIEASTRLQGVEELIDNEQYFVIHAARQSGKTTYLQDLTQRLNAGKKYGIADYVYILVKCYIDYQSVIS
jgi:predicted AAA+ superfamily ATPase